MRRAAGCARRESGYDVVGGDDGFFGASGAGSRKRSVARVYEMAWVGTVSLVDGKGEALHTIRYGATGTKKPASPSHGAWRLFLPCAISEARVAAVRWRGSISCCWIFW